MKKSNKELLNKKILYKILKLIFKTEILIYNNSNKAKKLPNLFNLK